MNPWEEDWSGASKKSDVNPWEEDWSETEAPAPSKKQSDVGTAFMQGVKEVPGIATGLADIPAGLVGLDRPFSRAADAVGEFTGFQPSKWAKEDDAKYSNKYKQQKAEIDAIEADPNKGFADMAKFYVQNPGYTGLNVVRSIPSLAVGGVGARALKATGLSAVTRGAAAEGSVMAGQQMEGIDKDVDPTKAALASLATGVAGAAASRAGGKLAQKMGIADVDTLLAGGGRGTGPVDLVGRAAAETTKRGLIARGTAGIAQEGLLEELPQSLIEQGAKNLAEDKPVTKGMMRAGMEGTLAGGLMGGSMGAISRSRPAQPQADQTGGADQAAQAAETAVDEAATETGATPPEPAPTEPAPTGENPLIKQQQVEQEKEAKAQAEKAARDALISKVGGVVPIDGTNMSLFNGKPYHNDDADGTLEKQITKLLEAESQKTPVRKEVESAYVGAFNNMNQTAIANGEKKPPTFANITSTVAKLVGGAQDNADAAARIGAQIDLKVGPNGKVSPEVELLQDVYRRFTGQEHPSVARIQELQTKEKADANPKQASVVPPAAETAKPSGDAARAAETPAAGVPGNTENSGQPTGQRGDQAVKPVPAVVAKPVVKLRPAKKEKAPVEAVAPAAEQPKTEVQPKPELVTVTRQGKQVQLPKKTLAKDLAKALQDPKKAPVINDVTGNVDGTPRSFREAAVSSLKRQGKETSDKAVENERKRIHKMLAGLGITEQVVDKVSAIDVETSDIEDVSSAPDSGFTVVNSPNATDVMENLTPKQKALQSEADTIMKEKADAPEVITAKEAEDDKSFEDKRRAEAEAAKQRAIAEAARSPYANEVREDWDDMPDVLDGVTPKFDELTMSEKAELVEYYTMYKNGDISYRDFEIEQRDIARRQEKTGGKQILVSQPSTGVLTDESGGKGEGQSADAGTLPGNAESGAESTEDRGSKKAPVVAIKKKRSTSTEAKKDFDDALSDLGDILGKSTKANLLPEQEKGLLAALTRLVGAAIRMGYSKLEEVTKLILDAVKKKFGAKAVVVTPARVKTVYESTSFIERNVSKLPPSLQGSAFIAATNIKDLIQRGVMGLSFGHDLADAVSKTLPSAKKFFDAMDRKEAVKNRLEIEIDKIASEAYRVPDRDKLNRFLKESTRSQKWGFKPSWMPDAVVDPVMESKYKALSQQSRTVATEIFKHGFESRKRMMDTVRAEINAGFDEELKMASDKDKAKIQEKRRSEMRLFDTKFKSFKGPYAPLSRFGDFVMVAKSQARIDAEKNEDTKWLNDEGSKAEHYRVEFHDSLGSAKWSAKQLEGKYASTVGSSKQAYAKTMTEAPWSALRRLKGMVNDHFRDSPDENKQALQQINQLLKDLYLSTLSEEAARKHDLSRKDIEGASDDMLKAFVSKGKADAHFMAALLHTGEVQDALVEMRKEAHGTDDNRSGRSDRTNVFNEILRRHAGSMDYRPTPVQDKILMLNSFFMLLTKPAYYLQNATQPFAMSLPVMAGRSGNYTKAFSELQKAYSDLAPGFGKDSVIKGFLSGNFEIDDMPIKADEKAALKKLQELGILDTGIQKDFGYWESRGGLTQGMADLAHKMTTLVKQVEVMNRVSTALASYRLAGGGQKGVDEAAHVVRTTHGNYSTFNAPSLLNKLPKLVTQFRKFQLVQLSLLAKLTHQSFKGADEGTRAAARASLGYTLGHYFVMAGALGMPAMSMIGWVLAAAFGDEEEPEDFEFMARKFIDNDEVADILLKGAPTLAGMDLSGTLGASNVLSILPFTDINLDSRKGWSETMMGLMGPAIGGTAPKIADGIGLISKGEIYKGFEKMLPSGLGGALKAYREATEGMSNKNNDMTLSPDEIALWDTLLTSLSLRTQTAAKTQFAVGRKIDFENFYKERTATIKHKYIKAWKAGDGDTMAEMRNQWIDVQNSKIKNGFTRQPMADLIRSPREQMKRERNTTGGVQFQNQNRRFVQEVAKL